MTNLYTMLTRKSERGAVLGEGQRLSTTQAIDAMTANGAYGSFSETVKGTLTPGMLADIAVWDSDIFSAEPDALLHTRCDLTVLSGEVVFDRHGQLA